MRKHLLGVVFGAAALVQAAAWSACAPTVRTFGGTGGQSTGTGGSGTGGTMEGCKQGDSVPCYEGPAETKDVGQCKSGMAVCGADGKPGMCEGQVLPATQVDCSKHEDQDCDGVPDRCPLDFIWGKAYGVAGGGIVIPSLDIDPMGDIVYGGTLYGQLDFGTGTPLFSASGDADGFIAKVDPNGTTKWAKKFGDATNDQQCNAVRADAQGNIIIGGAYEGTLDDLGLQVLPSAGYDDAFVAKLAPDGSVQWARVGGDQGYQSVDVLTLTAGGDVIVGGRFDGTFAFNGGGQTLSNTKQNGSTIFLQRFDKDGNASWGATLSNDPAAGYASQYIYDMAVDINGDVLVVGYFEGTILFPNGVSATSAGGYDIFVMKLHGTDGTVLWARPYGGPNDDEGYGLVTDPQGNVYVSGRFDESLTIGADTVVPQAGQPTGLFLAKLTPAGQEMWLKAYGCGSSSGGMLMGLGENNSLLLVGAFDGTMDFGGGVLNAGITSGSYGAAGFLAKLDSNGNHIASRAFSPAMSAPGTNGPSNIVVTYRVSATPNTHEIVVGGLAYGQFDLGGGVIGLADAGGPFLGKYAP